MIHGSPVLLDEIGHDLLLALGAPVGDDGHNAFEQLLAEVLQHIGRSDMGAVGNDGEAAAPESELSDLLEDHLVVRDRGRQQQQQIGARRAHLLDQRRCVGQRRRECLVDHQLEPELDEAAFAHRLGDAHRGGGVVLNERDGLRLLAGRGLGELDQRRHRGVRLRAAGHRGLEYIFESARR